MAGITTSCRAALTLMRERMARTLAPISTPSRNIPPIHAKRFFIRVTGQHYVLSRVCTFMASLVPRVRNSDCAIMPPDNPFMYLSRVLACLAFLAVFSGQNSAQGQTRGAGQFDGPAELPRAYVKSALSD